MSDVRYLGIVESTQKALCKCYCGIARVQHRDAISDSMIKRDDCAYWKEFNCHYKALRVAVEGEYNGK